MAKMIPEGQGVTVALPEHPGEAETLITLVEGLSQDFTVFHSVHWTRSAKRRTHFGEVDFVIVNRSGRVLVIEQKNGPLLETDEGLFKSYRNRSKSLQAQIGRSIDALRDAYRKQTKQGLIVDYLLYCPDHRVTNLSSPVLDPSRIIDARRKGELCKTIEKLLGRGDAEQNRAASKVLNFFRQTYRVVPDVASAITAGEAAYTQLSSGMQDVVRNLDFSPFRLRVQGVAGCGKTQVALSFLQEASEIRPTLYVCFNRPLRDHMAKIMGGDHPALRISTFHELCTDALKAVGQEVDFSTIGRDPDFWDKIVDRVIGIDIPEELKVRRLVVDEGQDFHQNWWDVLQLFLLPDYELLWFEDPLQNLRGTDAIHIPTSVTYHATLSYRTPPSIAEFIAKTHEVEFESAVTVPGMGVGVQAYAEPEDQAALLQSTLKQLRKQGFENKDIVVLTCKGLTRSELYQFDTILSVSLRKFTGSYDASHRPVYTEGKILFDSVHRFKGGQAPCVILVDVDPPDWRVESGRPVLFCGMTRATTRLEMFVQRDNPFVRTYLDHAN